METWRYFWAKTDRDGTLGVDPDWVYPLWVHLIDVGQAAHLLWDRWVPLFQKRQMARDLQLSLEETGSLLSLWIGLHDLGKAIPGFQNLHEDSKDKLAECGLRSSAHKDHVHHGHASIVIMHQWLDDKGATPNSVLHAAASCVGIHHGKLCQKKDWKTIRRKSIGPLGDQSWREQQQQLMQAVADAWAPSWPDLDQLPSLPGLREPWPDWLMAFSGWATLADWLGSMQTCYDLNISARDGLQTYLAISQKGAENALAQAGFEHRAKTKSYSFQEHFRYEPRPLQGIPDRLPLNQQGPHLVIAEAPTGEGKTEAAFYTSAKLGGGIYVAMPSQSTSDGIYPRLQEFLMGDTEANKSGAHDGQKAAVRLVHSNDLLHEDALTLLEVYNATLSIADHDKPERSPETAGQSLSWFMPKKRALLVPYGVGTVDQLFLGVLHAKHFFLRQFALGGKTVIFDEVHAYDAYMNAIFERLLTWLKALGVHVVVLSATLSKESRGRMLNAWGAKPETTTEEAPYPVVWHAHAEKAQLYPFNPAHGRGQTLTVQWCNDSIDSIVKQTRELIQLGACVMVICNTVARAQSVFRELDKEDLLPQTDRILLHARMPQAWRQEREKAALKRFGKWRPHGPALLVGTQVIEQSLDLDSDAMICDLAPIDLLLQRAGRLHRHERKRPIGFEHPQFFVACREAQDHALPEVDEVSAGGKVYAPAVLWRTWHTLKTYKGWSLPQGDGRYPGYRILVESVYGLDTDEWLVEYDPGIHRKFKDFFDKWMEENQKGEKEAGSRMVPGPGKLANLFTFSKPQLAEEDEGFSQDVMEHLRAATRNPDGVNAEVLLLHKIGDDGWSLSPNGPVMLHRQNPQKLDADCLKKVFGVSVRISFYDVVKAIWDQDITAWKKQQAANPILKRFGLIELEDGAASIENSMLTLHERLGLIRNKL